MTYRPNKVIRIFFRTDKAVGELDYMAAMRFIENWIKMCRETLTGPCKKIQPKQLNNQVSGSLVRDAIFYVAFL